MYSRAGAQRRYLQKATLVSTDLTVGGGGGGYLSPAQADAFIQIAIDASVMLSEMRQEFSDSPKWEVPRINFGSRILRAGVEATRLSTADQTKPTTGLVTLSTVLCKGEMPVSDETFEDNIERNRLADTIMQGIAKAVGRDLEELFIQGDSARTGAEDAYLDQLDGIIKQLQSNLPAGQKISAGSIGSYEGLFNSMLNALPARYRSDYSQLRFYVPIKHRDQYIDAIAARGTVLGDRALTEDMTRTITFRGIPVRGVNMMSGTSTINSGSVDYTKFAILIDPMNMIAGFHRRVRVEKWRDPREGVTSFIPTVRPDTKIAVPDAAVLASAIAL